LMVVILGGLKGITDDAEVQYNHLKEYQKEYKDAPMVTELSNIPIIEMDFLHNTDFAREHVKKGINFAKGLPIGGRKIVTFHLNTLVTPEEFEEKNEIIWVNGFYNTIKPALEVIAQDAYNKGVEVKVETVPVPEFGDIPDGDERTYRKVKFNQLRNPFYISRLWGFEQLYEIGLGICLDLCHTRLLYVVQQEGDTEKVLLESDRKELANSSLFNDLKALQKTDLVHLNDGSGIYSKEHKSVFKEGVALGQGDISDLKKIILYLNNQKIPFVLEINETDFKNRPNTKASIEYLLKL